MAAAMGRALIDCNHGRGCNYQPPFCARSGLPPLRVRPRPLGSVLAALIVTGRDTILRRQSDGKCAPPGRGGSRREIAVASAGKCARRRPRAAIVFHWSGEYPWKKGCGAFLVSRARPSGRRVLLFHFVVWSCLYWTAACGFIGLRGLRPRAPAVRSAARRRGALRAQFGPLRGHKRIAALRAVLRLVERAGTPVPVWFLTFFRSKIRGRLPKIRVESADFFVPLCSEIKIVLSHELLPFPRFPVRADVLRWLGPGV